MPKYEQDLTIDEGVELFERHPNITVEISDGRTFSVHWTEYGMQGEILSTRKIRGFSNINVLKSTACVVGQIYKIGYNQGFLKGKNTIRRKINHILMEE
ncbi:hypothetical protein ACKGJO_06785 [Gracilimonas sp. Q87]|uniref:hypothetical protein n=1 Tax=Gracilimonas sp. Q87 TaxID=3384766 RepID=UPI003983F091